MISVQSTTTTCSRGPVHCIMVTAIDCVTSERIAFEHLRIAERRRIALLLQLEAAIADAAGGIDREHKRDRNIGLRRDC